jgi:microsomal dipeptidase-like Zn-dependent dipeptidase
MHTLHGHPSGPGLLLAALGALSLLGCSTDGAAKSNVDAAVSTDARASEVDSGIDAEVPAPPLFGFADLHTHPTAFLGHGAQDPEETEPDPGRHGLFHGSTGLDASTVLSDLGECSPENHDNTADQDDDDVIRSQTRRLLVSSIEPRQGWRHTASGAPEFTSWPSPQSLLHQNMHVAAIRRAFEGGLRLVFMATTDSQVFARLYRRKGADPYPEPTAGFDLASARRQLTFLRTLVEANSDWMALVKTPAEARAAIRAGRLAIVQSLEMDTLSVEDILTLQREFGVVHVTPIHLVDNTFGGTSVFDDLLHANSHYMNGEYFQVVGDPKVSFRLAPPLELGFIPPLALPQAITRAEYCALGYEPCPDAPQPNALTNEVGHRNARGVDLAKLEALMRAGLLIDLAHMSENAVSEALSLAERHCYPLVDTHTGLRPLDGTSDSERDLRLDQAQRLARLGGVIGMGATGDAESTPLVFTRGPTDEAFPLAPRAPGTGAIHTLRVRVDTGTDNLAGGNNGAYLVVDLEHRPRLRFPLNEGAEWDAGSTQERVFTLPAGEPVTRQDIRAITLVTTFGGRFTADTWNVNGLRIEVDDAEGAAGAFEPIVALEGEPALTLSNSNAAETLYVPTRRPDASPIRLRVTVRTGPTALAAEDDLTLRVTGEAGELDFPDIFGSAPIAPNTTETTDVLLPPGTLPTALRVTHTGPGVFAPRLLRVDALFDPTRAWLAHYREALDVMGGRGVALGTDHGGFFAQMPFTAPFAPYEVDVAARRAGAPAGLTPLGPMRLGTRTYDVATDGVANYGLLPDMLQAVSVQPDAGPALDALFRSAEDVVVAWERVESARAGWDAAGSPCEEAR